ncbi:MAG: ATP-binding cassette domain-containing protein [Candidatus Heimdallarchaeota archaeon]|nr:ATP-binding cassette domain-containing protein [Candidatus Heimdallarchaeota archaeon]
MISCRDLIKIYEDEEHNIRIPALRGCDLLIDKGEIIAIVGPSGSGKTTLINILAGLIKLSSGECVVNGQELADLNQNALNRFRLHNIGLVDQYPERTLFLDITVEENMNFSTYLALGDSVEDLDRNYTIRKKLGIEHLAKRQVRYLSGGEMIRTAIACALAKKVPILLCDEPTGQLDSMNTEKVKALLREVAKSFGTTILVVTHDPRFYDGVDKSCEMRDGRVTSMVSNEEQKLLENKASFPIKFKAQIDSSNNIRIPDLVIQSLNVKRELDIYLEKNGNISLANPKGLKHKEINLKKIEIRRKTLELKPLPKNYCENKDPLIEISNLSKIYQSKGVEVQAISGIDLTIYRNELLFVVGPSGSGKTTLIKLLTGLENTTAGEIILDGENFNNFTNAEKADFRREKMGLVSQQGNLHPFLTIDDNFLLKDIISLKKLKTKEIDGLNDQYLKKFQIEHRRNHFPLEISGGELQRAILAIATSNYPPIVILDEPTANFDSELAKQAIGEIYKIFKTTETTIIIATHDISIIRDGIRVVELADGHIVRDGIAYTK